MDKIDTYKTSFIATYTQVPKPIYSWIIILVMSTILFIVVAASLKYKKYLVYNSVIKNGYLELYVGDEFFNKDNSDTLVINNKKYKYKVVALTEYMYNMTEIEYWKVILEVKMPSNWIVENNQIQVKFLKDEKTFFEDVIYKIKTELEK